MSSTIFQELLQSELTRIDVAQTAKRHENIIESFTSDPSPRAVIKGKEFLIFNSNDYLGLRFHPALKEAEHAATARFGTGPGAVRFISGSLKIHTDLEAAVAKFHGREAGMVFSSAFAANLAVLFCLLKGQSADSKIQDKVLVVSDELNHRSIIDGIRLANLSKESKAIFKHLSADSLSEILDQNVGKFDRVVVVTDGVFSMLGEYQDLASLRSAITAHDEKYPHGIQLVVDDCHGVAACGASGRGTEEITQTQADILVGTFGKGFGSDGGYVVGSQLMIDYLRESAATYIYSNSISPGTAGSALAAVELLDQPTGTKLLDQSRHNVEMFKSLMKEAGLPFAADSSHPIQPLLIGDPAKTKALKQTLYQEGMLVTSINYPVVPKGRDEIRIQISAAHTEPDLHHFAEVLVTHVS